MTGSEAVSPGVGWVLSSEADEGLLPGSGQGLNAGEMNCPHTYGLHVLQSLIYLMLLMRSASWGPAATV